MHNIAKCIQKECERETERRELHSPDKSNNLFYMFKATTLRRFIFSSPN